MVIFTGRQNLANLNEVKINLIVKFANLAGKSYIILCKIIIPGPASAENLSPGAGGTGLLHNHHSVVFVQIENSFGIIHFIFKKHYSLVKTSYKNCQCNYTTSLKKSVRLRLLQLVR